MFEQAFKNIDDVLWKEAGCTTELDYTEQSSWMLFLKYLDDLKQERTMEAELKGKAYECIIDEPHRWFDWAAPKKEDGFCDLVRSHFAFKSIHILNRKQNFLLVSIHSWNFKPFMSLNRILSNAQFRANWRMDNLCNLLYTKSLARSRHANFKHWKPILISKYIHPKNHQTLVGKTLTWKSGCNNCSKYGTLPAPRGVFMVLL